MGADVNARDAQGRTPLHFAVHQAPILQILLEANACSKLKDSNGLTALDYLVFDSDQRRVPLKSLYLLLSAPNTETYLRSQILCLGKSAEPLFEAFGALREKVEVGPVSLPNALVPFKSSAASLDAHVSRARSASPFVTSEGEWVPESEVSVSGIGLARFLKAFYRGRQKLLFEGSSFSLKDLKQVWQELGEELKQEKYRCLEWVCRCNRHDLLPFLLSRGFRVGAWKHLVSHSLILLTLEQHWINEQA